MEGEPRAATARHETGRGRDPARSVRVRQASRRGAAGRGDGAGSIVLARRLWAAHQCGTGGQRRRLLRLRHVLRNGHGNIIALLFSDLGEKNFSVNKANARENVLHVLQRTGVGVTWLENNSGCKGVCDRIETEDLSAAGATGLCASGECLDAIFVDALRRRLPKSNSDSLLVLHMKGSHGPAYFRRAPSARPFAPICATAVIQSCTEESLRNTYDNSIAYTSEVLAQSIDLLAADNTRDTVLLYVSDHGESLGERGIYLHGLPKLIAPAEQTRIPLLLWMSAGARERLGVDTIKLRERASRAASHDNLFPTLLGLFDVRARIYDQNADLLGTVRDRSPELVGPR